MLHARSKQKRGITESSLSFKSGRSGSKIGPYSQLGHRTGRMRRMDPKLPARYAGASNDCLPAARCTQATLFGKVDDLQFSSLRVLIDPKNQP